MRNKLIKKVAVLCMLSGAFFAFGACNDQKSDTPPAATVYYVDITSETLSMELFEEKQLTVDTNLEGVQWTSSNPQIVTVDENGALKAWKIGQATITATSGEYSDTCAIIVGRGAIVPEILLEDKQLGLVIGSGYDVQPKIRCNGDVYTDGAFTFSSNNTAVATVDENGRIQAVGEGTAIITVVGAWQDFGKEVLIEQIEVQVNQNVGLRVDQRSFTMFAKAEFEGANFDNTAQATYTLTKDGAAYDGGSVTWEAEDDDILTIDQTGAITAKKAGKTRVRAVYTENGSTVSSLWTEVNVLHAIADKDAEFTFDLWTKELPEDLAKFMTDNGLNGILTATDRTTVYAEEAFVRDVHVGEQQWLIVNETSGYKVNVLAASKIITTPEEFLYMHQYIMTDVGGMYDGYLVLGNDIDFTGFKGYKTGYGTGISTTVYDPYFRDESGYTLDWYVLEDSTGFNGTFDGRGHQVIGGKFANYGIFHKLTATGLVENVAFIDCDLAGSNESTTVARENHGTIRNVFVTVASACTRTTSGGITINNRGTIENCVVHYQGVSVIREGGAAAYSTTNPLSNVYTVTEDTALDGELAYATTEAFYQAWVGAGTVNTDGFDARYWDLSSYMLPVFKGYDGAIDLTKKLSLTVSYRVLGAGESASVSTNVPNVSLSIENLDASFAGFVQLENGVITVSDSVESVMTSDNFTFTVTARFDGMTKSARITVEKAKDVVRFGGKVEIQTQDDNELVISSLLPDPTAVQRVRVGDVEITGYTISGRKITLPKGSLASVKKYGDNKLQFVTADKIYEQSLFVISKLITTEDEFLRFFDDFTRTDTIGRYDGYIALGANLDFSAYTSDWYAGTDGLGWGASIYNNDATTVKTFEGVDRYDGFVGTLDGRGHIITNMRFAKGGFFYKIGAGGVIKNIAFTNCNLSIETASGAGYNVPIARYNRGTIDNVFVTVTKFINYGDNYAGIVHTNYGEISNCVVYYMGYVAGTGAIAYTNSGTIENAYSVTNVRYHENGVGYDTADLFYAAWKIDGEVDTEGFRGEYWNMDDYLIPVFNGFDGMIGETNLKNPLEITVSKTTLPVGGTAEFDSNMDGATFAIGKIDEAFASYVTLNGNLLTVDGGVEAVMTGDWFSFEIVVTVGNYRDSVTITVQKMKPVEKLDGSFDVETKADNVITVAAALGDTSKIQTIRIGGVTIEDFSFSGNKLSLFETALTGVKAYGATTIEFETETTVYEQSIVVLSKIIKTNDEFLNMYKYVQTSVVGTYEGYLALGADLDFSAYNSNWYKGCDLLGWVMSMHNYDPSTVKTDEALSAYGGFNATLDGRGHVVKGLTFSRGGIFYKIGENGVVKNIAFLDCKLSGYTSKGEEAYISTLAYHNYGEINNVFVTVAEITTSKYRYSGLVGINYKSGKIANSVVYFNPIGTNAALTDHYQIEAITQWNNYGGTITNVHAITDTARFISGWNKTFVKGYASYSAYANAYVQATYFKGIEYAAQLFTAFNASASALAS